MVSEVAECSAVRMLIRLRGAADNDAGQRIRKAFASPLGGKGGEVATGHIDNARCVIRGLRFRLGMMSSGEEHRRSRTPVGKRALDGSGSGKGRSDAGNDDTLYARSSQRIHFFRGATENERVADLQAHDALPLAGLIDHEKVDLLLGHALHAAALAYVQDPRAGIGDGEYRCRDEVVMQNYVAGGEQACGLDGEQIRIAGTRAHKVDHSLDDSLPWRAHCDTAVCLAAKANWREGQVAEPQASRCASW